MIIDVLVSSTQRSGGSLSALRTLLFLLSRLCHCHGRSFKFIKPLTSKTCCIGWVYRMHQKFGHRWVECREPSDLTARHLHIKIGLYQYQKSNESKWTHDLIDHMMIKFRFYYCPRFNGVLQGLIIMSYILWMKKSSITLSMESES